MSSIKEIAKYVGISPASVSIYLNDRETRRVSAKTKEKIDEAVEKLNYHKNLFASSLSKHESKLIGVIIPTILPLFQNDYTNALLCGLQYKLSSLGYGMLFFPSSARSSIGIVQEQLESSAGCDGYILFSTGFCTLEQIQKNVREVSQTERPFVTLNIPPLEMPVNQVLIDALQSAPGMGYLIDSGHTEIITLLGRSTGEHTRYLYEDALSRLREHGLPYEKRNFIYGQYDEKVAYAEVMKSLEEYPEATAICCMSDVMAAAAIKAAEDTGKRVPDDISIIGRNNTSHSRLCTPSVTTVDLHMNQAGTSAANLLFDGLSGSTATQKLTIGSSIIERGSVRRLR